MYNNCYEYKGHWIEVFVTETGAYTASVELPNRGGVVLGPDCGSRDEAEFAAEELIDSWN